MDWQQLPLWIAAVALALLALRRLLLLELLLRQRFQAGRSLIRPRDKLPSSVREILALARPRLSEFGFEPRYGQVIWNGLLATRNRPLFAEIHFHPGLYCHAAVLPAEEPEPGALYTVEFLTCYADGRQLLTLNRRLHTIPALPPDWLADDAYAPTLEAQWELHRQRMNALGDAALVDDPTEAWRRTQKLAAAYLPHLLERGLARPTHRPGVWRFTLRGAVTFLNRLLAGARRAARARPRAAAEPARVQALADAFAYARSAAARDNAPSHWLARLALFGGSAVLGALAFGMAWSWQIVPALLGVLLFHELGHLVAMRLSGYRDLNVFFIPFVGAAASGRKDDATPWQRLFVYLAGPLPGLILGAGCLYFAPGATPELQVWLVQVGALAVVLNFLNLLPFLPLDGGRIVETLLFARLPRLRIAFLLLSAALLLAAGVRFGDGVLLAIGGLILATLPAEFRLTRLMRWLKLRRAELGEPKQVLRNLFAALAHSGATARLNFSQRSQAVRALLPLATQRAPRLPESLLGLSIYAAVVAAPLAVVATLDPLHYIVELAAAVRTAPAVAPVAAQKRDWEAELLRAASPAERWQILYDAARWHEDGEDVAAARAYYQRALAEEQGFAADDMQRAEVRIALARTTEDTAQAITLYEAAMAGLGAAQGADRLRVAEVLEALYYLQGDAPADARIDRLDHALAIRESLPAQQPAMRLVTRRELALAVDSNGDVPRAEQLLRRNADADELAVAKEGTALLPQADLAWFLIAHGRAGEAEALLQPVLADSGSMPMASADPLRVALAWAQLEQGKLDDASAGLQDMLEREDSPSAPSLKGVARFELLLDLALVSQRRNDAASQAAWRAEAGEVLRKLPGQPPASQRYAQLAAASRDWQSLRWQRYAELAAAL